MGLLTIILWLLALILIAVVVVAVALIVYARWNYGTLEKLGFQVVKPHWFLGSNYNGHEVRHEVLDVERSKTYGHVYGIYDGRTPVVCISDPVILRKILATDFEHFRNHKIFFGNHPVSMEVLDFLKDEKWKTVRSVLTPEFTTVKIKKMMETVRELSEDYVTALISDMKDERRIKLEFKKYVQPLVLEIIGKCFCGIVIENARDPNNKLIRTLKDAMGGDDAFNFDWTFTYASAFPILEKFTPLFTNTAMDTFEKTMRGILKSREKSRVRKADMVNTLLNMCKKSETDDDYKRIGITDMTALGQAFEFFFASYEAVQSVLSVLTFHLASDKEIQKKLLQEIDSCLEKSGGEINYDSVADLPYLTACISETLRIAPTFFRTDRRCTKDWEYNGIKIKKGMLLSFPLYALHHHSEYYENPEKFNPERFMPGQKENLDPYAFGTFGHGPRACIGQRFAYEMLKIIVCHYLKEFTVEKREDTIFRSSIGNPMLIILDPIFLDFVRRN